VFLRLGFNPSRSTSPCYEAKHAYNTHNTQYKNDFKHSEMGPVRQNPIHRTVSLFICVCIALCTIVAHNIAQNRLDSFPPYLPDNHHSSDDVYLREGDRPTDRPRYSVGNNRPHLRIVQVMRPKMWFIHTLTHVIRRRPMHPRNNFIIRHYL